MDFHLRKQDTKVIYYIELKQGGGESVCKQWVFSWFHRCFTKGIFGAFLGFHAKKQHKDGNMEKSKGGVITPK